MGEASKLHPALATDPRGDDRSSRESLATLSLCVEGPEFAPAVATASVRYLLDGVWKALSVQLQAGICVETSVPGGIPLRIITDGVLLEPRTRELSAGLAQDDLERLTFVSQETCEVGGSVRHADTGESVPDFDLQLWGSVASGDRYRRVESRTFTTDPAGAYAVRFTCGVRVSFDENDKNPGFEVIGSPPPTDISVGATQLDFLVAPHRRIHISVESADGTTIPEATLTLWDGTRLSIVGRTDLGIQRVTSTWGKLDAEGFTATRWRASTSDRLEQTAEGWEAVAVMTTGQPSKVLLPRSLPVSWVHCEPKPGVRNRCALVGRTSWDCDCVSGAMLVVLSSDSPIGISRRLEPHEIEVEVDELVETCIDFKPLTSGSKGPWMIRVSPNGAETFSPLGAIERGLPADGRVCLSLYRAEAYQVEATGDYSERATIVAVDGTVQALVEP